MEKSSDHKAAESLMQKISKEVQQEIHKKIFTDPPLNPNTIPNLKTETQQLSKDAPPYSAVIMGGKPEQIFPTKGDYGALSDPGMKDSTDDPVNHPPYYTSHPSGVECIQITEHMNFCLGNAMKYLWRSGEKGNQIEDLKKAQWYISREIERLNKKNQQEIPW